MSNKICGDCGEQASFKKGVACHRCFDGLKLTEDKLTTELHDLKIENERLKMMIDVGDTLQGKK